ncbi:MAG: SusC/RagA family TonB-linked outer membrane protein [Flavobacteriales bacterium]|nr:SusC/RagA family TonB-linked outer membrane protein [Flavobacteriales bacterium]
MNKFLINQRSSVLHYLMVLVLHLVSLTTMATEMLPQPPLQGTVRDAQGVLPGVTVLVKGTATGTMTDENGRFFITAEPTAILVFSYLGYQTVEVTVGMQTEFTIVLVEDNTQLKEVVVNAGYYSVKDKERTGSISRVTASEVEQQPVTNVLAAMQGRMAGVNIVQETGMPGGGFAIQIRGINSLRSDGNAPLYVIDGVPYSSDTVGSFFTSSLYPTTTSPLNSINPNAIASIEVLKDADATAIYGSRGANGVVLITTKKGQQGKTTVQLRSQLGIGQVATFMDLMNTREYLALRRQAFANDGITEYPEWAYDVNGVWDMNRSTDWQKELLGRTAILQQFDGSVSGGSPQTQYIFGGNYSTQTTVFPGEFTYQKGGAYLNLTHRTVDDRFLMTFSGNYISQRNFQPATDLTVDSRRLSPNAPALYDAEGNLNWENSTWINPLASLNGEFRFNTNDLIANSVLSYQLLPSLTLKSSLGYTQTNHLETRTAPSTLYNPAFGLGPAFSALFLTTTQRQSWIVEPQVQYKKAIGEGVFEALLGSTFQQQHSSRMTQYGIGFSSNALLYNLSAATLKEVVASDETDYHYQAFFGRLHYQWKDTYFLNLTGRRDGSSRFGTANQFAYFGAIGAAWIFSKEAFLPQDSWFSFGKLRMSYGTSGNDQIGDYQYLDTYSSTGVLYDGLVGLQPSRLFNPNFSWETNRKFETALELGFFDDRLFLTGSYFLNRSSNQLVGLPLPGTTGFTSLQSNLDATVENSGFEFTLRATPYKTDHFEWSTQLNLSVLRNRLVSFPGLEDSVFREQYRLGEPLSIQLAYQYLGVDPQTGLYQFQDVNGDGQISFPDDRQTVVDLTPTYFGGFQNQLKYKRLTLDFLFQFVKQRRASFTLGPAGGFNNQPAVLTDSWQSVGDVSTYQIPTAGFNEAAVLAHFLYESSTGAFEDASFVRLKNLSLTYDLPLSTKKVNCQLFLQGQNLLTFSPYRGGDPEFNSLGFLPPLRVVSTGVQFTF